MKDPTIVYTIIRDDSTATYNDYAWMPFCWTDLAKAAAVVDRIAQAVRDYEKYMSVYWAINADIRAENPLPAGYDPADWEALWGRKVVQYSGDIKAAAEDADVIAWRSVRDAHRAAVTQLVHEKARQSTPALVFCPDGQAGVEINGTVVPACDMTYAIHAMVILD